MAKMTSRLYFKVISLVLITAFIALDISWAYPPENGAQNCNLAAQPACQQQPMTLGAERFQQSVFSQAGVIGSVGTIARYLLGDPENKDLKPLPLEHLEQVLTAELGGALTGIDLSKVMIKDGVVFVPYKRDNEDCIIQIALKDNLAARDLAGYEWVISDKYVVKRLPRDYKEPEASAMQPISAGTREEPKVTITAPIAEETIESAATSGSVAAPKRTSVFSIRAIIRGIATILLMLIPLSLTASLSQASQIRAKTDTTRQKMLEKTEESGVASLIEALKSDKNDVKCKAIEGLGRIKDARAVESLKDMALNDKTSNVYNYHFGLPHPREEAIKALQDMAKNGYADADAAL